ncbi:MAG: hypothetical protein ACE5FI_18975, partial [Anaerolineales bacterium]
WELNSPSIGRRKRLPRRTPARLVQRRNLPVGAHLAGPAIVLEQDATVFIPSGWDGHVVSGGYLRIGHHARPV